MCSINCLETEHESDGEIGIRIRRICSQFPGDPQFISIIYYGDVTVGLNEQIICLYMWSDSVQCDVLLRNESEISLSC